MGPYGLAEPCLFSHARRGRSARYRRCARYGAESFFVDAAAYACAGVIGTPLICTVL